MAIDTVTRECKGLARDASRSSNPADGSAIANVPLDGPAEVAATVARVRANQPAWEALGIKGRAQWLDKLRDWLLDHQDEIADTMQRGDRQGPRRGRGRGRLRRRPDQLLRQEGRASTSATRSVRRALAADEGRRSCKVQYRPYPVVGVISPWNFPLILSLGDAIPALHGRAPRSSSSPPSSRPLGLSEIVEAWKSEIGGPDVFDVRQRHGRDRLGAGRRGRLRPVHRLRPDRPRRCSRARPRP